MNKNNKFFPLNKRKLRKLADEDRKSLITEKDVEFLKNLGLETDLETLKNGGKKPKKRAKKD